MTTKMTDSKMTVLRSLIAAGGVADIRGAKAQVSALSLIQDGYVTELSRVGYTIRFSVTDVGRAVAAKLPDAYAEMTTATFSSSRY